MLMVIIMKRSKQLLVIDVDGTMTDAGIYYDENGNELKNFVRKVQTDFLLRIRSE